MLARPLLNSPLIALRCPGGLPAIILPPEIGRVVATEAAMDSASMPLALAGQASFALLCPDMLCNQGFLLAWLYIIPKDNLDCFMQASLTRRSLENRSPSRLRRLTSSLGEPTVVASANQLPESDGGLPNENKASLPYDSP